MKKEEKQKDEGHAQGIGDRTPVMNSVGWAQWAIEAFTAKNASGSPKREDAPLRAQQEDKGDEDAGASCRRTRVGRGAAAFATVLEADLTPREDALDDRSLRNGA